ncbi:MAG: ROK family protein [Victivallaceae bacterium]|nr:ROK family protein [Victivallaceae bacterium]
MTEKMKLHLVPELDPAFEPVSLVLRAARTCAKSGRCLHFALERAADSVTSFHLPLPDEGNAAYRLAERTLKTLLWCHGARRVFLAGDTPIATRLASSYAPGADRAFDADMMRKIYEDFAILPCRESDLPPPAESARRLGGHTDGARVGFDLGGSNRKCAAVLDGKVVHSESVKWNPYFERDAQYHKKEILDSIRRAAAHLPRLDAVGGSSAGVFVDNQVRVSSLFRGIAEQDFAATAGKLFLEIAAELNVPFAVLNDGEVAALAGKMSEHCEGGVLGLSLGTSLAGGYVRPDGTLTDHLDELAFVPLDLGKEARADEWSGDFGCAVQYLSQQAVACLAQRAGFSFASDTPAGEVTWEVRDAMERDDPRAKKIYRTLGVYLGHAAAYDANFYDYKTLLLMGGVAAGKGAETMLATGSEVLAAEFPELAIDLRQPGEAFSKLGQSVVAASLPQR